MNTIPLEAWTILGTSILSAVGASVLTHSYLSHRMRGIYNRGWNAGREFALKHLTNTIVR